MARRTPGSVSRQVPQFEIVAAGKVAVSAASSKVISNKRVWESDIGFAAWESVSSTATVKSIACANGKITVTLSGSETGVLQYFVFRDASQEPNRRGAKMSGSRYFSRGVEAEIGT